MTQRLTGMPAGGDGHDHMMAYVARLDELEKRFAELLIEQADARLKVELALKTLPEQQERVLRLRYIEGLSWRRIAWRTHYSEPHLRRINAAALKRLAVEDER